VIALVESGTRGDAARRVLMADPDWAAPAHTPLEVLRTLRRYESSGTLTSTAATTIANEVLTAEVRYAQPDQDLIRYVWRHRHNLSPYDAPYVALAARHQVVLVTNDVRLAHAAQRLGVATTVP
jgi:predicted nucleic acid-binding protein